MKLSISNIAWHKEQDEHIYTKMKSLGFSGLEIAPTRIIDSSPYERINEIKHWHDSLFLQYGFEIPSMQSIWFGRSEKLFGSEQERKKLVDYTRKAVLFAENIACRNLVFGCPRNRVIPENADPQIAVDFFRELGDFAAEHNTVIGMEANPAIYNTNYINNTPSALELIRQVNSKGFMLNLDIGTMLHNHESIDMLYGYEKYINHVHISEAYLAPIEKRNLHISLAELLRSSEYKGFVSIEMGQQANLQLVTEAMEYVAEIFG